MKKSIRSGRTQGHLARIIRERRQLLKLSQTQVAEKLGVSEVAVIYWESGKRAIDLDRVPLLAQVLGIDPGTLSLLALSEAHPRLFCHLAGAIPSMAIRKRRRSGTE